MTRLLLPTPAGVHAPPLHVRKGLESLQRGVPPSIHTASMPRFPGSAMSGPLRCGMLAIATLLILGTCRLAQRVAAEMERARNPMDELARVSLDRRILPQLSFAVRHRPCIPLHNAGDAVPRAGCQAVYGAPPVRLNSIVARASAAREPGTVDDAAHALALIDLLWTDENGTSLQRSISSLQGLARRKERPGRALADLAAAHLVRAERTQNPRDLLQAVTIADSAAALEPQYAGAHFNLALALELLGLQGEASESWKRFLMLDSTSAWAEEARMRMRNLEAGPAGTGALPGGSRTAVAPDAGESGSSITVGWDQLLGRWGTAVLEGDSALAAALLARAERLGSTLERRNGGDASLADAVRAIQRHAANPAATEVLAGAHRAYAAGRAAFLALEHAEALRWFDRALAGRTVTAPLRSWTLVGRAAALTAVGPTQAAGRLLDSLLASATPRYPAQIARIRWCQGTLQLRARRFQEAVDAFEQSAEIYARLEDVEHEGAVQYLRFDAQSALGNTAAAYEAMYRALRLLRAHQSSVWLHNLLYVAAEEAAADGMLRGAVRLQNEGVRVAARTGVPFYTGEARLARARLLARAGNWAHADRDVRAARIVIRAMKPGLALDWLRSELLYSEAEAARREEPVLAEARLDSAAAFFERQGNPLRLFPVLLARADVRLSRGRVAAGEADLRRAIELLDTKLAATETVRSRALLLDDARAVFDRAVMLRVRAGREREALAYLEQGRPSFSSVRSDTAWNRSPVPLRAPGRHTALVYSLIGDTLLIWTVVDTTIHLREVRVEGAALAGTVQDLLGLLEAGREEDAVRHALTTLYDCLIRPVESRLRPGTPLVLVADGVVAGVPFAALRDSARGQFLIEGHRLRLIGNLRDATRLPARRDPARARTVLISNPAFRAEDFPGLEALPGADTEVSELRPVYPDAQVVRGKDADRGTAARAFRSAAVLHFAGHALFDDQRPERSALVLAPAADAPASGRLGVPEIERMDLRGMRLVVLSACRTARGSATGGSGFVGLTTAFLAAGAHGVVGSLWRVDDAATKPLMLAFHRQYSRSGDAEGALRSAQLALLRSADPALRSPSAWAGFRYTGS